MNSCFEARAVWKTYGRTTALAGVSLRVCGGLNIIVGPNGSGKSTLLKLWSGLARPTKGSVSSLGLDPWRDRVRLLRRVAVGFESTRLPPWMRGLDVIGSFAEQYRFDPKESINLAEGLGLRRGDLERRIHGYSMGMRKKLLLSIALRPGLEAYLLDEPYTLLDPPTRMRLDEIIRDRAKTATVIVASHFSTRGLQSADRLIKIESGKIAWIQEKGVPAKAYRCPTGTRYLEKLFETKPARLTYDSRDIIVIYDYPREPPLPGCQPVLVPDIG